MSMSIMSPRSRRSAKAHIEYDTERAASSVSQSVWKRISSTMCGKNRGSSLKAILRRMLRMSMWKWRLERAMVQDGHKQTGNYATRTLNVILAHLRPGPVTLRTIGTRLNTHRCFECAALTPRAETVSESVPRRC